MSAFGYGSVPGSPQSYGGPFPADENSSPRGGGYGAFNPLQEGASLRPQIPIGAQMNFNPDVTTPWERQQGIVGMRDMTHISNNIFTGKKRKDWQEPIYGDLPWNNPIQGAFGGINNIAGPAKENMNFGTINHAAGAPYKDIYNTNSGTPAPYGTGSGKGASLNNAPLNTSSFNPTTIEELTNQIGQLDFGQLLGLDTNGKYKKQFGQVAQDYANAYANSDYAAGASMTQQQAQNHLQDAYGQLTQQLNNSYLL